MDLFCLAFRNWIFFFRYLFLSFHILTYTPHGYQLGSDFGRTIRGAVQLEDVGSVVGEGHRDDGKGGGLDD